MSFCRFGWDSDVYVYESNRGLECCGCVLGDGPGPTFTEPADMVAHLREHIAAGHKVRETVIPAIEAIDALTGDPDEALANEIALDIIADAIDAMTRPNPLLEAIRRARYGNI